MRTANPSPIRRGTQAAIGAVIIAVVGLATLLVSPGLAPGLTNTAGTDSQSAAPPSATTGETTSVTVTVDGMAFVPSVIQVPVGNTLEVTFENTGDQLHDLHFANGAGVDPISPGSATQVDVGPITADMDA